MSKISVLMSVYKKENPEYLRASLESILVQTRTADEILLIEDGPLTQELYQVVAEYQKKCDYLHVHAMEQNVQLGRALAKGVELCQYDLIARMDTDDIAMPDRLEKEEAYMEAHPEVDVVGGAIREFNDEGTIDRVKNMPKTQEEILEYVKVRNPLNHMTVMYRKDSILKAGNYKFSISGGLFAMEQDVVTGISVQEHGRYTCPGENKHGISKAKKWMGLLQGFSKT